MRGEVERVPAAGPRDPAGGRTAPARRLLALTSALLVCACSGAGAEEPAGAGGTPPVAPAATGTPCDRAEVTRFVVLEFDIALSHVRSLTGSPATGTRQEVLLDQPVHPTLTWADQPPPGELADLGVLSGFLTSRLERVLPSHADSGARRVQDVLAGVTPLRGRRFLGWTTLVPVEVSFTLRCGAQEAAGVVRTWRTVDTGVLQCSLPQGEGAPPEARTVAGRWC